MKRDIIKAAALLMQVGISMLVPIVLCVFVGKWLDSFFNTGGILLIVFAVLGVGAGFRSVYDLTKSFCKEKNEKEYRFSHPKYYLENDGRDDDKTEDK